MELKIQKSNGRCKNGCRKVFIRPDYYCYNRSRSATGFTDQEIQDSINNVIRKWYSELIVYEVDGQTIVSNNENNALTEYWRVCERVKIGQKFQVIKQDDYDLPMNWEPDYNAPDKGERQHEQAEIKKLK